MKTTRTPSQVTAGVWASLPMPALLIDAEARIAGVNPAAEAFLNASARTLIGRLAFERILIDAPVEDALLRARRNQSPIFISDVGVTTGGRAAVSCNVQLAPLHDTPGFVMVLIVPRDSAERNGRVPGVKSAIGMAQLLAHEIKNPLAGISGAAQLLSMGLSVQDRELTDLIVEETRRIVKLLEQVEQFGNLLPPARRAVNIHDALERARKSALFGFASHLRIIEDYDPSLPLTWADPDQLMQVFLNLIRNAAQACQTSGTTIRLRTFYDLTLRLRRKSGAPTALPLTIEIIDDGPGIAPDVAASIFEPFVSGRENGTGLGLALVSKIISDHEGWIQVDSVPGRTVFRVSLPMAQHNSEAG